MVYGKLKTSAVYVSVMIFDFETTKCSYFLINILTHPSVLKLKINMFQYKAVVH